MPDESNPRITLPAGPPVVSRMVDIAYDHWVGYVIRFPNRWGCPTPFIRIGGSRDDWHFIWCWLCDQVAFRLELALQAPVLLLKA